MIRVRFLEFSRIFTIFSASIFLSQKYFGLSYPEIKNGFIVLRFLRNAIYAIISRTKNKYNTIYSTVIQVFVNVVFCATFFAQYSYPET